MSITSLWKSKGSRNELSNDRGIFNVSKVRSIFDKVIYSDVYETIDQNMSCSNVGGRKKRNIRDHLFVVYAAINDVINGQGNCFDIQGYDVMKCFDEMWFEETLNDLWDVKIQDDKFALITKLDEKCRIVVKTPCGTTDRFELSRIVLQGSVFGPIKCAVQMDTIGSQALQTGFGIFKYKSTVDVPGLAMIDDVMGMASCGDDSIEMNSIINSKMEIKKLRLSEKKCYKIHISKTQGNCTQILKVHDNEMKAVSQATYLGDVISETGKIDETVIQRSQKATGIICQISSILSSICLGSFHFDIALVLREALFINGILNNSEIWYNFNKSEIEEFESLDRLLLRKFFQVPFSTPQESFYLELGILPIGIIIQARRINYLQYLVSRSESEMLYKFFITQWNSPCTGDWTETFRQDLEDFDIPCSLEHIKAKSKLH